MTKGASYETEQQRAVHGFVSSVDYFFCNMVRKARWSMSFLDDWVGALAMDSVEVLDLFERHSARQPLKMGNATSTRKNHDRGINM
ncbi:hypothetical protein ACLK1T_08075 [Escherichia coli]